MKNLSTLVHTFDLMWGQNLQNSKKEILMELRNYSLEQIRQPQIIDRLVMDLIADLTEEEIRDAISVFDLFFEFLISRQYVNINPFRPVHSTPQTPEKFCKPSGDQLIPLIPESKSKDDYVTKTINEPTQGQGLIICSFEDLEKEFFKYRTTMGRKKLHGNTIETYRNDYKQFQRFVEENFSGQISIESVEAYVLSLYEHRLPSGKPLTESTIARKKTSLRSLIRFGKEKGLLVIDNSFEEILATEKRDFTPQKHYLALTMDEIRLLFHAIKHENERNRILILLILLTGVRRFEAAHLKKENFDFANQIVHVLVTKNGLPRDIPIPPFFIPMLQEYLQLFRPQDFIFPSRQSPNLSEGRITDIVGEFFERLGMEHTPHNLRATFATNMYYYLGKDILLVHKLLGHKDLNTTKEYIDENSFMNQYEGVNLFKLYAQMLNQNQTGLMVVVDNPGKGCPRTKHVSVT